MCDFSSRLLELRNQHSLSQQKLADIMGVKDSRSVRAYEKGEMKPSIKSLCLLSDYFGVSIEYLLGRKEDSSDLTPEQKRLLIMFDALTPERQQALLKLIEAF